MTILWYGTRQTTTSIDDKEQQVLNLGLNGMIPYLLSTTMLHLQLSTSIPLTTPKDMRKIIPTLLPIIDRPVHMIFILSKNNKATTMPKTIDFYITTKDKILRPGIHAPNNPFTKYLNQNQNLNQNLNHQTTMPTITPKMTFWMCSKLSECGVVYGS